MINFIICINNKKRIHLYKEIIQNYMRNKSDKYMIYVYYNYNDLEYISGKNIYFFEFLDYSELDIVKNIRYNNDWNSQIIISFFNKKYDYLSLIKNRKLFMLDILYIDNNWFNKFKMYLDVDYNTINKNKSICFKYCNEVVNILYNDIYYIEKNLYNNDSTIVTKNNKYIINLSINKIMKIFNGDIRFYKCHRSCIVNIDNVISYDIGNNIVKFYNNCINLVSRDRKKELEMKIINKYVFK